MPLSLRERGFILYLGVMLCVSQQYRQRNYEVSVLPNADKAVIPLHKFTEYSLNLEHPTGRHKAHVFQSVLGLTIADAEFLQETIRQIVTTHETQPQTPTPYGERYVIDFTLTTSVGSAVVRTTWIIRWQEDFPRLTGCYVK